MPRLVIDLSEDQHAALKAEAALQHKTMRAFVTERLFRPEHIEATGELKTILAERIQEALDGDFSPKTFRQIVDEAKAKVRAE